MKKKLNAKKIIGLVSGLIGVLLSRQSSLFEEGSSEAFFLRSAGVVIACIGIAVYGSGIRGKKETTIRICPHCFKKNNAALACCRSCKKPLE